MIIKKSWWRKRWYVYKVEHTEGDYTWLASFRYEVDAFRYVNNSW